MLLFNSLLSYSEVLFYKLYLIIDFVNELIQNNRLFFFIQLLPKKLHFYNNLFGSFYIFPISSLNKLTSKHPFIPPNTINDVLFICFANACPLLLKSIFIFKICQPYFYLLYYRHNHYIRLLNFPSNVNMYLY